MKERKGVKTADLPRAETVPKPPGRYSAALAFLDLLEQLKDAATIKYNFIFNNVLLIFKLYKICI